MKRSAPLSRRSRLSSRTAPARRRRLRPRNDKRAAAELLRCFGPPERRAWVTRQPCAICARQPTEDRPHQNAHVTDDGTRGMSRRSGYTCIVSLCHRCHEFHHAGLLSPRTLERLAERAARTQAAWELHLTKSAQTAS